MLSTSFEFREKISQNSKTLFKATLTLADGTVVQLTGDDVMMGSATFDDAVSSDGSFDIGAAVINQFGVTLNNYDRRFDEFDFTDSTIVPYVGVQLDDGIEWLMKGHYWVEQPESYGSTIRLTALDNMRFFEKPYNEVNTVYPASLRTIVMDICEHCDVTLSNTNFANGDFAVPLRPGDDALTCLEVIGHAAQASGNFARIGVNGQLVIDWYNTSVFEGEDWLDGQNFDDATPYASGDDADGGNFLNYASGDHYDGGEFSANVFANVHAYKSATVITDDVVITGIRVTAMDEVEPDGTDGDDGETALYGNEGYVLTISDNPLVQYGRAADVAARVGARVVGMTFRPFDVSAVGNPAVEAGDPIVFTDRLQNQYFSYITTLTYKVGGYEAFACNAESPGRNRAASYSAMTKAIVRARNAIKKEKSARERAVEELARELSESSGLYMTLDEQPDHSIVYYMHDKPTLAESQVVWKLSADAFGISTDGGATYPYGLDVGGNAILNRIYAIGLNASYIDTGALVIEDGTTTVFSADLDTKQVRISGDCVTIGSESLTTAVNGVRALYGTCITAANQGVKVVVCDGFVLRPGAVVNVKFTYANNATNPELNVNGTGAKPIYVNNAPIAPAYFWNVQDVVTFVYSGSYWYVADSGTLSKIKATADSITLSVAQTYATKSELSLGLDSISLSITNGKLGSTASISLSVGGSSTTRSIDLTGVRNAFKNDTSAITITAGTVTFNSNTFVVNSTNFSVTSTGVITAKSGTIGGFTIGSSSLYRSRSSLSSGTYGVYIGTDGISVGSGTAYTALSGGYLYGGSANNTHGYVGFNNYWRPTGIYGARLAGRGCIALLTNGAFGIGSYYNFGTEATITTGQSGTISYIEDIWDNGDGSIGWRWSTLTFTKGLMTTSV